MICERCGVVNRAGRTTCIHCLGPLKNGSPSEGLHCAEHPSEPATGRCVTCNKLVCEACGGVVSNRGVYCIDHTPAVTTTASASPGMNPLLGGPGAMEAAGTAARAKAGVDRGVMAAVAGLVALLVYFGLAFGIPGWLRSREVPAPPPSLAGGGAYGGAGGGYPSYGAGGYGTGGYASTSASPMPGGPPGGPMGGPPGGPVDTAAPAGSPTDTGTGLGRKLKGPAVGD